MQGYTLVVEHPFKVLLVISLVSLNKPIKLFVVLSSTTQLCTILYLEGAYNISLLITQILEVASAGFLLLCK